MRVAAPSAPAASSRSSSSFSRARAERGSEQSWPKNEKRVKITLACEECKRRNYITMKSRVNDRERIEMNKYCRWDKRHTVHKETR